jgi:hypothetical protein
MMIALWPMLMMTMAWITAWTASEAGSVQSCAQLIAARTLLCSAPTGLHLTPSYESLIAEVMARFGKSREEAIRRLNLHGGI